MSNRITIVMDDANLKKLKVLQARLIVTEPKSVSFSRVVNRVLKDGLNSYTK